jgi:hypothetical protein
LSIEAIKQKTERPVLPGMVEYRRKLKPYTLAELREVLDANPKHPKAGIIRDVIKHWGHAGGNRVFLMDQEIVMGIIDNQEVQEIADYSGVRETHSLMLGKKLGKEAENGKK